VQISAQSPKSKDAGAGIRKKQIRHLNQRLDATTLVLWQQALQAGTVLANA
jgi:hypothetical protein